MSYINATLQAGERVTASGKLHWIIYLGPLLLAVIGVGMMVVPIIGLPVLLIALISLFRAWFQSWTTELAVTDRRVIYKTGFIRRHSVEMNMGKIESVVVNQSILGRLLDFGTIHVMGTGQGMERLRLISAPLAVRDSITAR